MKKRLGKWITWHLIAAMFVLGITPRVYAGFSPSEMIHLSPAERSSELLKVQNLLEQKLIRERLTQLGYTPAEISTRLTQLDDQQIHQLALQMDEMKVGGNAAGAATVILLLLILVVVIFLFTGHKVVIN